jgi:hydroxyacylglutathione hydrolase
MLRFEPVPAFADNYIWVLSSSASRSAVVVDPGEAGPVFSTLDLHGFELSAILITHHHADHVGGVRDLLASRRVPVFGPESERIDGVDQPVRGGSAVGLRDLGVKLDVIDVPGHTAGHVAYIGPGFVLVGDTLFAGGCGRVFEGTPEQMCTSLRTLAQLPPDTEIYCAHEYTAANLRFGLEVEPGNSALEDRLGHARELRAAGEPTIPSILSEEVATNIFLRCTEREVVASAEARVGRPLATETEVFAVVRRWKDGWRA